MIYKLKSSIDRVSLMTKKEAAVIDCIEQTISTFEVIVQFTLPLVSMLYRMRNIENRAEN